MNPDSIYKPSPKHLRSKELLAFAIGLSALPLLPGQGVSASPAKQNTANAETTAASSGPEETITLSPFVVDASSDKGYFAENTLAGSRMKSNVGDLAAAISVVTKQQLEDTGSVDINDAFRYEVNTEGSSTYTPNIVNRGTMKDSIAGYTAGGDGTTTTNADSNRVRGMSAPDISLNYYKTSSRVPLDSYNIQSIEVSRGPNSLLFGMGSPAGIVNQSLAQASTTKNQASVSIRTDDSGSFRQSFNFNRVLIRKKLGLFGAMLYDDKQFVRKPSYDRTNRFFGALTWKPTSKTTVRGFVEKFANNANRPNSITPRDYVSHWIASGRPAYDSVARTVTVLDSGRVIGNSTVTPYVWSKLSPGYNATALNNGSTPYWGSSAFTTSSPYYTPGIDWDNVTRALIRFDGNQVADMIARQPQFYVPTFTYPVTATPSGSTYGWVTGDARYTITDRAWTASVGPVLPTTYSPSATNYSTYYTSSVTDKSIYDWTKYNINQANFSDTHATSLNLELEQELTKDLYFSAGWLRQEIEGTTNNTLSQLTGATIKVDTNLRLPDGSLNQYFGLPFVAEDSGPDTFRSPETNDSYRAMLSYNLDFSRKGGWLGRLGSHRLLAMYSGQRTSGAIERWRNGFVGGDADATLRYGTNTLIPGKSIWSSSGFTRYYYLASPGDTQAVVAHSSGRPGNPGWDQPFNHGIRVYNFSTNTFQTDTVTTSGMFADAGSYRRTFDLKSLNFGSQSSVWGNRLVATLGWRRDTVLNKKTSTGILTDESGATLAPALTSAELYTNGVTNYDLVMNRWTRWFKDSGDTKTLGLALRPFKSWSFSQGDSLKDELLNGLTLYYNASDNFNPSNDYKTDYYGKKLPAPTGEGRDIGIGLSLLRNKLVTRISWYDTKNYNERTSLASTLMGRLAYGDTQLMLPWAQAVTRIRRGANVNVSGWNSETTNPVMTTDASIAQVYGLMQLPVKYYDGLSTGATQDSNTKGIELQVTFNPTPAWTMKLTGSQTMAKYANIAPQFDAWYTERMAVWKGTTAADIPDFVDGSGVQYSLKNFWSSYGYTSNARLTNTDGNTNAENYFNNTVMSQVGQVKSYEGTYTPTMRKYRASYLTTYTFRKGKLKGFTVGGAERYQSRGAIGFHGKATDFTKPTQINASDVSKPIWSSPDYFTDLWVSYSTKILSGRVGLKLQLNVDNVTEGGHLEPYSYNWDGTPWAYRIVDPRAYKLTATFSF